VSIRLNILPRRLAQGAAGGNANPLLRFTSGFKHIMAERSYNQAFLASMFASNKTSKAVFFEVCDDGLVNEVLVFHSQEMASVLETLLRGS
jgi:hypothetical protein